MARRPAARPHRVLLVAFPGAQVLDVTGPLETFATASRLLRRPGAAADAYSVEIAAREAGPFATSSGLRLVADRPFSAVRGPVDTLLVAGGLGTPEALEDAALLRFLRRQAPRAGRVASICTGAFLLAGAGLLEGRRATTHWAFTAELAARHPGVRVEPDRLYVRDGAVWSSAGVTAGMDLALALLEEDHGRAAALDVARRLVLFLHRPGGQAQFSTWLEAQGTDREPVREAQRAVLERPGEGWSVTALARRAGMSPRHFARVFARDVGCTPARFVERARVEAARRRLEESDAGVEEVAEQCGFGSAETLRRAFLRSLRVSPADYRKRFRRDVRTGSAPGRGPAPAADPGRKAS